MIDSAPIALTFKRAYAIVNKIIMLRVWNAWRTITKMYCYIKLGDKNTMFIKWQSCSVCDICDIQLQKCTVFLS